MNPLDQLKDIHLPEQVSTWPPAYGWWILILLILFLVSFAFLWLRNRHRQQQAKRDAQVLMNHLDQSNPNWHVALNEIFKRICISYYSPEQVASQYGQSWLQFLAQQMPQKHRTHFVDTLTPWVDSLYQSQANGLDFEAIKHQSQLWFKHFSPPKQVITPPEVQHV